MRNLVLAGLLLLGSGFVLGHSVGHRPATEPHLVVGTPESASGATAPMASVAGDDRHVISAALASHGNTQQTPVNFFIDLIKSMERGGLPQDSAREAAVALARNPHLDTIADLTVAGCLPTYVKVTGVGLGTALIELIEYIEQPDWYAKRANDKFGIIPPEQQAMIRDKARAGSHAAAERLVERALLERFNPSLGAKILVPM